MDEKHIRELLSNVKCKQCGQDCGPTDIGLLGHRENYWFLSVYCPSCKNRGLAVAIIKESEVPQLLTELTEAEEKSMSSTPVSSDDVIDMHIFLKDFSGDFSSLFSSLFSEE